MAIDYGSKVALYNLGLFYAEQRNFNLAIKYYLKAILFDADTIKNIISIMPTLSCELQLEILELVPLMRTHEYFNKFPYMVHHMYNYKKIEMVKCLSPYLIDDMVDICLAYY
jgi:tetratricopeptide (TPR) repeat protein